MYINQKHSGVAAHPRPPLVPCLAAYMCLHRPWALARWGGCCRTVWADLLSIKVVLGGAMAIVSPLPWIATMAKLSYGVNPWIRSH